MIPQGVQVFVALDPVDMRFSFDRLSIMVTALVDHGDGGDDSWLQPMSLEMMIMVGHDHCDDKPRSLR